MTNKKHLDWFDRYFIEFLEDYENPISRCMLTGGSYIYAGLYLFFRGTTKLKRKVKE